MKPQAVIRENEFLRRALGVEHGRARYQWEWSNDLTMPMVLIGDDGKPEYDFFCGCGRNVSIHSAACQTFTIPKPRWEIRNLCPELQNQWVLCRWLAPEASRDDWERTFAGEPYPASGYLVPVGTQSGMLAIPSGDVPFRQTSEMCVDAIKGHALKTTAEYTRATKEKWASDDERMKKELESKCRDAFPVHEGLPGQKNEWSHGGMPDVASPVLAGA